MPSRQPVASDSEAGRAMEEIAAEHRALGETLERLEGATDPHRLLPELEKLRRQLQEHFAEEEAHDGLGELVGRSAPHLLAGLQRVLGEHRDFLGQVESITARTRDLVDGPLREIRDSVATLVGQLRDHESRESDLLREAVATDFGSGD